MELKNYRVKVNNHNNLGKSFPALPRLIAVFYLGGIMLLPKRFTVEDKKAALLHYIEGMASQKRLALWCQEAKVGIYSFPTDAILWDLKDCDDIVPDEHLKILQLPLGLKFGELVKKLNDFPREWVGGEKLSF